MKKYTMLIILMLLMLGCAAFCKEKKSKETLRVYRFEDLEIEGQSKNPALMYFLKRIRNQFRSSKLTSPDFTQRIIDTKNADFLK